MSTIDEGDDLIEELAQKIAYHSDLYYNQARAEINDAQFDSIFEKLKALAPEHPQLSKVGSDPDPGSVKVEHLFPMKSLDIATTTEEIIHFYEVTTEGGLDVVGNLSRAKEVTSTLVSAGIPVSLFIDPETDQLEASAEAGAPWVELHTGSFARAWFDENARHRELNVLRTGMDLGVSLGLRVNAGHGINYLNVAEAQTLSSVFEFNIGHSIISRALFTGIEEAVATMRSLLNPES